MAFESLTERLQGVFKNLRRKGKLSEKEVLERLGGGASVEEKLPEAKHIFSHVEWQMIGYQVRLEDRENDQKEPFLFVEPERLEQEYFYPLFLKKEIFHLPEAVVTLLFDDLMQ